jgi:DNA-binding response OmpR family regulator
VKESDLLIAIVDDNVGTVTSISNILDSKGFRTVWAYNGAEAVKLCKSAKPNLLILDVRMPNMTGFDIAKQLPGQKILFMSAHEDSIEEASKIKGSIGVIKKPISAGELIDRVRKEFNIPKPSFE